MKNVIFIFLILITLVGCNKKDNASNKNNFEEKEQIENIQDNIIEEEKYVDDNPIKISFYQGSNGVYRRLDKFKSQVVEMSEIGIFSIVLSDEEEVYGSSIKNLFQEKSLSIENFNHYKIGFNVKFTLQDGRIIDENIFKPLNYGNYGFSHYLYAWIYDDINTTGWHSHIEEDEYNENTIMSSIKLMWGPTSNEIASDVELSVFTYDEDDFLEDGSYRGISKFTTIIERS